MTMGKWIYKQRATRIFRILEMIPVIPEKGYSGAIVNYPENDFTGNRDLMIKVIDAIRELHKMLNVNKTFQAKGKDLQSYDVAHHAGMSIDEEYEMLGLMKELQRQEYLRRHLQKVLPVVAEMEALKEKVKLNGHFRNLGGFEFNFEDTDTYFYKKYKPCIQPFVLTLEIPGLSMLSLKATSCWRWKSWQMTERRLFNLY